MGINEALAEASPAEVPASSRPDLRLIHSGFADSSMLQQDPDQRPNLYAVPDPIDAASAEAPATPFINADSIPELAAKRQSAREHAAEILGKNRHLLYNGGAEQVPTPVDALGTAQQVVEIKRQHGAASPEYGEAFTGLELDSERLLGEAATKNVSEHFEKATQVFQPETNEYFSHGLSISRMTENGLSPLGETEEQDRRVGEHVDEHGTSVPMGSMIASGGLQGMAERLQITAELDVPVVSSVETTTISECTDYAERDYAVNPKGAHAGYRPAIKGIAIRRNHFEDDSGDRQQEQVIISGIYITHDLIEKVLAEKGAIEQGQKLTKTELHASQFISVNDGSVMEFVRELDERASEAHGKNLFMGEEVPADHPKDYYEFIEEARERKERLAPMPTQLAELLVDLEEQGIDSSAAEILVNKFLKEELLARAKNNPELAEAMFDKATAEGFKKVAHLEAQGRHNEARSLRLKVEQDAPEASYCGGGGCGTKEVDPASAAMARQLGLTGTELMLNTEHACKNCNAMQLCHDELGNTACLSCESTKHRGGSVNNKKDD